MLIDDRQIHSLDVNKLINTIDKDGNVINKDDENKHSVVYSNSYNDLKDIPEEFPPEEHIHDNVTENSDGFMSKEEYIKLRDLSYFNKVSIESKVRTDMINIQGYIYKEDFDIYFKNIKMKDINKIKIDIDGYLTADEHVLGNFNFLNDENLETKTYCPLSGNIYAESDLNNLLNSYKNEFKEIIKNEIYEITEGAMYKDDYNFLNGKFPNIFKSRNTNGYIVNISSIESSLWSPICSQYKTHGNNFKYIEEEVISKTHTSISGYITEDDMNIIKNLSVTSSLRSIFFNSSTNAFIFNNENTLNLNKYFFNQLDTYNSRFFKLVKYIPCTNISGLIDINFYSNMIKSNNVNWNNIKDNITVNNQTKYYIIYVNGSKDINEDYTLPLNIPETLKINELLFIDCNINKDLFIKYKGTEAFKRLTATNLSNEEINTEVLEAEIINDTLNIKAEDNIILDYDENTNTLSISADYTIDEANLKGEQGPKGEDGKQGYTYLPSVDSSGNLSFYIMEEGDIYSEPNIVNIKGSKGESGKDGIDRNSLDWFDIKNKPTGEIGEILVTNKDKYCPSKMLYTGFFPNSEEELNNYKNNYLTNSFCLNFMDENFLQLEFNEDDNISRKVKNFTFTNNSFSCNADKSKKMMMILNPETNIGEYLVALPVYSYNYVGGPYNYKLDGVISLVLAAYKDIDGNYNTLSLNLISDKNIWNIPENDDDNFYNVLIVLNAGTSNEVILGGFSNVDLVNEDGYLKKNVYNGIICRKYSSGRLLTWMGFNPIEGKTVNQLITNKANIVKSTNQFSIYLNATNYTLPFMNKTTFGIGCYKGQSFNEKNKNPFLAERSYKLNVYPIYNNEEFNTNYHLAQINGSSGFVINKQEDFGILDYIGPGHFLKDIPSGKIYYFYDEENIIEVYSPD